MNLFCNNIDSKKWTDYVKSFDLSNIYHSEEMQRVYKNSNDFEQYSFFVEKDGKIVASAYPVLVKIKNKLNLKITNRFICYSSPLYLKNEDGINGLEMILNEILKITKKKALFFEIRNSEEIKLSNNILERFTYIPYQNYIINLSSGTESLKKSFNSFTRNHINRGARKGAIVKECTSDEYKQIVELFEKLYAKKNIPFIGKDIFHKAYEILFEKKMLRAICMIFEGKIVGGRVSLNFNNTVLDWYAASEKEFSILYPNEALAWNTIEWGAINGYKYFDFGGGAIKGQEYGPAKFKEKFRGELVEYGRYRYISNKLFYNVLNRLYDIRTKKNKK
jgi:lipid II:glycine glycyltransferase (peptidoglycan interpeptide bridge formation enzyme)